ncbi:hypothetical protein IP86_27490, partial [Rhodopseudomonas sp. AAP120]
MICFATFAPAELAFAQSGTQLPSVTVEAPNREAKRAASAPSPHAPHRAAVRRAARQPAPA